MARNSQVQLLADLAMTFQHGAVGDDVRLDVGLRRMQDCSLLLGGPGWLMPFSCQPECPARHPCLGAPTQNTMQRAAKGHGKH